MRIHVGALRFDLLAVRCPNTQAKAVRFFRITSKRIEGARDQFFRDYGFKPCHAMPGFEAESDAFVRGGFNRRVLGIRLPSCASKGNVVSTQNDTGARLLSVRIECAPEWYEQREENDERNVNFHSLYPMLVIYLSRS